MKEPCSACRHSGVPPPNEPCLSCISFVDSNARRYTNFEALRSFGVDMAAPDEDKTVILVHRKTGSGPFVVTGYESLGDVLGRAYDQAAKGKGAERHGQGLSFDEQPMRQLIRLYGVGFALGQAAKKAQEAQRLPTVERQVAELLGAINYLAGAVIALEADNK